MKIRVLPYQPHCFAFGGFEIQMRSALAAVQGLGVDAQPLDPWSTDSDFEILHVWGFGISHQPAIHWAKKAGKRVVMTALLPYISIRLRARYLDFRRHGVFRLEQELVGAADAFVVVNNAQAETAIRVFGVRSEKIAVIPNIVEAKYFHPPPHLVSPVDVQDYVLCTGNVCPRKNQLRLAQASIAAGVPLVIVGDTLAGEEAYGDELSKLLHGQSSIRWLKSLDPESDALIAAYQHCAVFSLPSFNETQPISALEASALRKPLLMGNSLYAKQKYYANALQVDPNSVGAIRAGVEKVISNPERFVAPLEAIEECRAARVGTAYRDVFRRIMAD